MGDLLTLDDLGEVRTTVTLTRPDGRKLAVPMRTLSEQEVWELRQGMKWPKPPLGEPGRWDGANSPVTRKPLLDDPKYTAEMSDANRRLSRRMLARSLVMELPGDGDDAKADALEKKLGAWAAMQLTMHMNRLLGIGEPEVDAVADSFHAEAD